MKVRFRESVILTVLALFSPIGPAPATGLQTLASQQSIEQLALRAEHLENDGKLEDAESVYREILKIDPRSIAALNRLGAIEVRRGQFAAGIRYYQQALDLSPSEFATNLNLGIAFIKKQDYASAVPPLEQAARPARIYDQLGQHNRAREERKNISRLQRRPGQAGMATVDPVPVRPE